MLASFVVTIDDPTDEFAGLHADIEANMLAAANLWGQHLEGDATIEILIEADNSIPRCTGRSGASVFVGRNGDFNVAEQSVAAELRTGVDPNGAAPDVLIPCSRDYVVNELWFDPSPTERNTPIDPLRTDAVTVFLHELGHAIAFNGWMDTTTGEYPEDWQSTWDRLIFFDGTNFFFVGDRARTVYGGDVPITFGRFWGHLGNQSPRPGADLIPDLMNGVVFYRGRRYEISTLDLAILEDTGVLLRHGVLPTVNLSVDSPTISENGGTSTVTARLSAASHLPITVELSTSGVATPNEDYVASTTQIMIPVGVTRSSTVITGVDDRLDEPDETVIIDITKVTNGTEASEQQVTVTILDDDEPPLPDITLMVDNAAISEATGVTTFSVMLSETTSIPVTVDLEITGTATSTDDYIASGTQITVGPGNTSGSITVTAVQDTLAEPNETVIVDIANVAGGNELGTQQQTTTIIDDDNPLTFTVTSLTPTSSGFVTQFSHELDTSTLNLYDTQTAGLGPADVVMQGAASGSVRGSLVVDPSARMATFLKTGSPLLPDTYTVSLRSGAAGFRNVEGELLDGDGDGTAGDDMISTFTVAPPENAITVSLVDFVRGPGQDVNLPANTTAGIPLSISEGTNVREIDLQIRYDPAMLKITSANIGADTPAGATVVLNNSAPGLAVLNFFSSTSLPAGPSTFVNLHASVPATKASEIYQSQEVLDVHDVMIRDGADNELPVIADDAFHLSAYFGDVSGNRRINAADAAQVARIVALLDTGFAGSYNADPILVGDISGNGRLNAADASRLARFVALIPVSEIPPIPVGVVATGSGGFGAVLLMWSPQNPLGEAGGNLDEQSTEVTSWNTLLDYYATVDELMTVVANRTAGSAAGEEVPVTLEEATEKLFSALDLPPSR